MNASFPEEIFEDGKIRNAKFVKPTTQKEAENTYNVIMQQNNWTKKDWNFDATGWYWYDKIYKGTIAIPVDTTILNLVTTTLDAKTASMLEDVNKAKQARENWNYEWRN